MSHLVSIQRLLAVRGLQSTARRQEGVPPGVGGVSDRVEELLRVLLADGGDDDPHLVPGGGDKYRRQQEAHQLLKHLFMLFLEVEQLLVQRYQCVGGSSHFLALAPLAIPHPDGLAVVDPHPSKSAEPPEPKPYVPLPRDHLSPPVTFTVGQVLRHKLFNYRGVCVGWDIRPSVDTSLWEGVKDSKLGTEQPYYRVSGFVLLYVCRPSE